MLNENQRSFITKIAVFLPFFIDIIVYYAVLVGSNGPNKVTGLIVLKVEITLLLGLSVMLSCYSFQIDWKFCSLIAAGLAIASVGDGFSVIEDKTVNIFFCVMIPYGCAHILYTIAYGFTPVKPLVGAVITLPFIGLLIILIPKVQQPLNYCLPFYIATIVLMVWRILTKISQNNGSLTFPIISAATGVACLAISEGVLSYDKFHSNVKYAEIIVPITYYIGQIGIAYSVFHLPHKLRPRDPNMHISCSECYAALCV